MENLSPTVKLKLAVSLQTSLAVQGMHQLLSTKCSGNPPNSVDPKRCVFLDWLAVKVAE